MKKWFYCLIISLTLSLIGLAYFVNISAQEHCLDSGHRWIGLFGGCDGESRYSVAHLISSLTVSIFFGIVLGASSFLFQLYSMLSKFIDAKKNDKQ